MKDEYGDQVEIIGIGGRSDAESMQAFIDGTGTGDIRHVLDVDGELWDHFEVSRQGTFIIVDENGATTSPRPHDPQGAVEQLLAN